MKYIQSDNRCYVVTSLIKVTEFFTQDLTGALVNTGEVPKTKYEMCVYEQPEHIKLGLCIGTVTMSIYCQEKITKDNMLDLIAEQLRGIINEL